MPDNIPDLRSGIVELLELLSSPEKQLEYEKNVPHVSIPEELVCMWFDDLYMPEIEAFMRCFTAEELLAMADFNSYFDNHEKTLPEPTSGIASWLGNDVWQNVMRKAEETLIVFRK